MTITNMERFIEQVHDLAPELFVMVKDHALAYSESRIVEIDENYKFPVELSIDKTLRNSFAQTYYSTTKFTCSNAYILEKWLQSIPAHHRALIKRIEYHPFDEIVFTPLNRTQSEAALMTGEYVFNGSTFVPLRQRNVLFLRIKYSPVPVPGFEMDIYA